jgi:hypothetical protein
VAVSTVGDADAGGEAPVILARAPTDFTDERMQDWLAGRMLLTGDGLFALRCVCLLQRRAASINSLQSCMTRWCVDL